MYKWEKHVDIYISKHHMLLRILTVLYSMFTAHSSSHLLSTFFFSLFFVYSPIKFFNRCILPVSGNLMYTPIPGKSGPGSNGNEGVLYIPHISRTGPQPSDEA